MGSLQLQPDCSNFTKLHVVLNQPMLAQCLYIAGKIIVSTFLKGSTVVIIANVVYPVL